jgi:hypothetical protein
MCQMLEWDSEFFGRRIARVAAKRLDATAWQGHSFFPGFSWSWQFRAMKVSFNECPPSRNPPPVALDPEFKVV